MLSFQEARFAVKHSYCCAAVLTCLICLSVCGRCFDCHFHSLMLHRKGGFILKRVSCDCEHSEKTQNLCNILLKLHFECVPVLLFCCACHRKSLNMTHIYLYINIRKSFGVTLFSSLSLFAQGYMYDFAFPLTHVFCCPSWKLRKVCFKAFLLLCASAMLTCFMFVSL